MADTVVELPDPLTLDAETPSGASADDLLAQLAGDDIDRLLADAEADALPVDASSATPADATALPAGVGGSSGPKGEAVTSTEHSNTPSSTDKILTSAAVSESSEADVLQSAQADLEGELDQLLNNLNKSPAEVWPVSGQVVADLQVAPLASPSGSDVAAGLDSETSRAERSGLGDVQAVDLTAIPPRARTDRGSWVLKPLILINSPFAGLPDATRSVLGKVAIVTLINAAAVLVYVTVFRKH